MEKKRAFACFPYNDHLYPSTKEPTRQTNDEILQFSLKVAKTYTKFLSVGCYPGMKDSLKGMSLLTHSTFGFMRQDRITDLRNCGHSLYGVLHRFRMITYQFSLFPTSDRSWLITWKFSNDIFLGYSPDVSWYSLVVSLDSIRNACEYLTRNLLDVRASHYICKEHSIGPQAGTCGRTIIVITNWKLEERVRTSFIMLIWKST